MGRKTLEKWIDEAMTDPEKKRITAFTLVHMQGMQHMEIHSYKFKETGSADPKNLAAMFRGKAEAYCQDLPGMHTCVLWAFYGTAEPEARQPFTVNVQTDHTQGGLTTEPPTEMGITMQKMRHGEALVQQVYRRQQQLDEMSLRMIEMLGRQNTNLIHENMASFEVVKNLMEHLATNNHNREMQALQFKRDSDERAKLMSAAPAFINTLAGKEVIPQSTEDTAIVEAFASQVDEDMLGKIMGLGLPDTLVAMLVSRVQRSLEKKRKDVEATRQLPIYRGNPEDDITGGTH